MDVIDLPCGLTYINSTFASDTFNIACFKNLGTEISIDEVKQVIDFFNSKNLPFAWWVGPNSSSYGVDNILKTSGLKHVETEVGMTAYAKDIRLDIAQYPQYFEIKQVESKKDFESYGYVMASVFQPFDHEAIKFYQKVSAFYNTSLNAKMFIGYLDQKPTGICFTIYSDDIGGIYDIVAAPQFQRRGIGTVMTQQAITQLKSQNCNIIGMQASKAGMKIYKKLGFKPLGEFQVYSIK